MQIAFCSNFMSSHQRPLCDSIYGSTGCDFRFIASKPLSETRKAMGWEEEQAPYVIASYDSEAAYQDAVDYVKNSDVVIISGDQEDAFFKVAIKNKEAIIFRCCERIYKKGRWRAISPRGIKNRWNSYYKYPKQNLYMLCSSAYAAGDFALLGSYLDRTYKWGYFTEVEDMEAKRTLDQKDEHYIFWAGRMLDWKRPESAICVAAYLKERNIPFRMGLAGDGSMREKLQHLIEEKGLTEQVQLLGSLSQEKTCDHMRKASIFLATSNYEEGWGAVVSEAMSRACAVVACEAMGSVPFLIRDRHNGYSYPNGDEKKLCQAVEQLLTSDALRRSMGQHAYETMNNLWNPKIAAQRLIQLATAIRNGDRWPFEEGPCSKAHIFRKGR